MRAVPSRWVLVRAGPRTGTATALPEGGIAGRGTVLLAERVVEKLGRLEADAGGQFPHGQVGGAEESGEAFEPGAAELGVDAVGVMVAEESLELVAGQAHGLRHIIDRHLPIQPIPEEADGAGDQGVVDSEDVGAAAGDDGGRRDVGARGDGIAPHAAVEQVDGHFHHGSASGVDSGDRHAGQFADGRLVAHGQYGDVFRHGQARPLAHDADHARVVGTAGQQGQRLGQRLEPAGDGEVTLLVAFLIRSCPRCDGIPGWHEVPVVCTAQRLGALSQARLDQRCGGHRLVPEQRQLPEAALGEVVRRHAAGQAPVRQHRGDARILGVRQAPHPHDRAAPLAEFGHPGIVGQHGGQRAGGWDLAPQRPVGQAKVEQTPAAGTGLLGQHLERAFGQVAG
jgi:hypothetical protein